jgi:hypothetical protein
MKKKHIIIILILLLILFLFGLLIYIFLTKNTEEKLETPETIQTEKHNFINANIETNCAILFDPELKRNPQKLNPILTANYKKYGFPVENHKEMIEILKKHENDTETTEIIKLFSNECDEGKPTKLYEKEINAEKETQTETTQE